MDYKTLHGGGSRVASSRSIVGPNAPGVADGLDAAMLDEAFETIDQVEGLLAGVAEGAPPDLIEPALAALTSGGKRLRPLLLVLSAHMGEPEREDLLQAAAAIEVLHTATLIHDDIVDRAESRRGVPTTVAEYGREIAATTGDFLFAEAFSRLAGIRDPRLVRAFAVASVGLASGALEQYRANGADVEVEAYLEHIKKKTAGLFQVACVAGATLGGLSLVQIDALASYGLALGIAFQMSDDIMDLVGKPGLMGKGIGTDLVEGTVTLPVIFALREGDAQTIRRVLADPSPTPELLEAGIEAVLATGAIARTEAWARGEIDAALRDLALLPDCPECEFLESVASEVVGRDA